jgi:hypothetical protein
MKISNENKKKIIKITVYAALIIILQVLSANVKNRSAARFMAVAEIVLAVLISKAVLSLSKNRVKIIGRKLKEILKKTFGPILNKIREMSGRRRRFVRGSDEKRLVFNFNIIEKLKNKLKLRKKLDLKHSSSNIEKIKLLYIKLILTLMEKHHKVKYSHTPKEIKNNLKDDNKELLFDIYEKARYDDENTMYISNETVKLCENITDK